jgi:NADH-quinone oxidoreductase subunit M
VTEPVNQLGFPLLSMLVLVPLGGAVLVALIGRSRPGWVKLTAILSSVFTAALSVWVLVEFPSGSSSFEFVSRHPWINEWGISWHLGVDGISLFLVVLTGLLFPLVILGVDPHHDEKPYLAWMLLLEAGVMGSFLSLDLFLAFSLAFFTAGFDEGDWGSQLSDTSSSSLGACWWK